jgi:sugar phosphate isomerase/epimerase
VNGISSSIKVCEASRLRENIEEAKRTIPIARELGVAAIRVFGGGDGWLIFEHEKRWHPELPEPEETLPQFVTWIRRLLEKEPASRL